MKTETVKKIEVSHAQIEWNSVIESLVTERLKPIGGAESLKKQVESKSLILFGVSVNDIFVGCFFVRVEILLDGQSELVIVHGIAAQETPVPFTSLLNPIFDKIAKDNNFGSIRIHSDQKGIDEIAKKNGYVEIERVFRKKI